MLIAALVAFGHFLAFFALTAALVDYTIPLHRIGPFLVKIQRKAKKNVGN